MNPITIGIVEDKKKMARTLSQVLEEGGIQVKGIYSSAEEALEKLPSDIPAMLLVDLGLPGMDGVELIHRIRKDFPGLEILVFTVFDEKERVFDSLKAGATGYILKDSSPEEILGAIGEMAKGGAPMSKKIAKYVLEEFRLKLNPPPKHCPEETCSLSVREKDVLHGLARGLTYQELAVQLDLSTETVKTHIKKIYQKLQVNTKISAINKAMDQGLL